MLQPSMAPRSESASVTSPVTMLVFGRCSNSGFALRSSATTERTSNWSRMFLPTNPDAPVMNTRSLDWLDMSSSLSAR